MTIAFPFIETTLIEASTLGTFTMQKPPQSSKKRLQDILGNQYFIGTLVGYLCVLAACLFATISMSHDTINLPWYINTEEFPYAQEVLRFISLDFNQRFFDIPGTPLIFVITLIFVPILYIVDGGHSTSLAAAAFDHLQLLYVVMRSVSLVAFTIAVFLIFKVTQRFASRWGAVIATVVFATHPILATTLYHTRIEPFSVMLVAASLYAWLKARERRSRWRFAQAGLLAGLAMAARFQLATAVLPMMLFDGLVRPVPFSGRRGRWLTGAGLSVLGAIAIVGGALAVWRRFGGGPTMLTDLFLLSAGTVPYPFALTALAKAWVGLGALALIVMGCAVVPQSRRFVARYADSSVSTLMVTFPIGFLVGVPTLFVGANYFLASVNMFFDRNNYHQEGLASIWSVVYLYLFGSKESVASFTVAGTGLEAGALYNPILIVMLVMFLTSLRRRYDLKHVILLGCVVGVVSQFGKLQGTRHISGWLPWFTVAIAIGYDRLMMLLKPRWRLYATAALCVMLFAVMLRDHRRYTVDQVRFAVARTKPLRDLQSWIALNVPHDERVFYACCETATSGVILNWMEKNGVAVPPKHQSESTIWFGDLTSIMQDGEGYIVTSNRTWLGAYVDYYKKMKPSEVVDPDHDPRFTHVASFDWGREDGFQVYHFVLRGEPKLTSGGMLIEEASYGLNCMNSPVPPPGRNTVSVGNATRAVSLSCGRRQNCNFELNPSTIGDPAPQCAKDLVIRLRCDGEPEQTVHTEAEALGKSIDLACMTDHIPPVAPVDQGTETR